MEDWQILSITAVAIVGIVLMVPAVATVALSGLLGVPLGNMLTFGLLVILATILVSIFIMNFFIHRGFWDVDKDQEPIEETQYPSATDAVSIALSDNSTAALPTLGPRSRVGLLPHDVRTRSAIGPKEASLLVMFGPMLLSLVLIGGGALAGMAGFSSLMTDSISTPVIALLVVLLGTSLVARQTIEAKRVEEAVVNGFRVSGQVLILTGAGGALAVVVAAGGTGDVLGGYFSASSVAPLLVVWGSAASLHIAVGLVSISATTAAGLLAPVTPTLGFDPVLIALAAAAGSLFFVRVMSNTFWLLQSMLGQTTRETFKTCSIGVSGLRSGPRLHSHPQSLPLERAP